jgi:hypothetical protein
MQKQVCRRSGNGVILLASLVAGTLIVVVVCVCFTAIHFAEAENHLNLDIEAQPNTVRVKATVGQNNDLLPSGKEEGTKSEEP